MRRRALAVLVLAGVAGLAAAGCGGGGEVLSKDDYGAEVAQVGDTLETTFETLSTEARSISSEEVDSISDLEDLRDSLAEVVGNAAGSVGDAADTLEDLDAPEDAQADNADLVEGLRLLAADITEVQTALEEGDFGSVIELAQTFQAVESSEAGQLIQNAIDDLKSKGYEVEGN